MNLYLVETKGFKNFYVVATDPTSAYAQVREYLDKIDYGFENGRELKNIELLAKHAKDIFTEFESNNVFWDK